MPERQGTTDLINKYSVVYLDKINVLAVFRNHQIIFEGPLTDSGKALETLCDYYTADRDDLDEAYNSTVNDIKKLTAQYKPQEEK